MNREKKRKKKKRKKREIEIEEILKEVDNVASMDSSSSFGRQMVLELLDNIRHVLFNKTQIIKNLKYSLALATKVKL